MSAQTQFLLARIAEDEAAAHKATIPMVFEPFLRWMLLAGDDSNMPGAVLAEPSRVLAECEAKRRIVEDRERIDRSAADDAWHSGYSDANYDALQAITLPYADHPDYDPAWQL